MIGTFTDKGAAVVTKNNCQFMPVNKFNQLLRSKDYLFYIIVQHITETLPSRFWNQNGVPEVSLHLGDGHVPTLLVSLDIEIEIFIFDPQMFVLRGGKRVLRVA